MNKVWLYVGGVIVGPTVSIYAAITTVKRTHPPASDQRRHTRRLNSALFTSSASFLMPTRRPMPRTMAV